MGKANKYGFEKKFAKMLNGPFPFFVIWYCPLSLIAQQDAINEELAKAAGDGFRGFWSYFYLLKISRLIEKELIPEKAMFIDKYFDHRHSIIFSKNCLQSIQEIFKVLEKEALGKFQWKLITHINQYEEIGLVYPRLISQLEIACMLPGHPSHEYSTSTLEQVCEKKNDPELGDSSLLTRDDHSWGEESEHAGCHELSVQRVYPSERDFELDWEPVEEALLKLYACNRDEVANMFSQHTYIEEVQRRVAEMTRRHSDSQKRIHEQLEQSLISHLTGICTSIAEYEGYDFLQEVSKNWTLFCYQVPRTMLLFESVGPSWTTPLEIGISLWVKYIIAPGKLITTMVSHITENNIQHDLMSKLRGMLEICPSAVQWFETLFVGNSRAYYETKSKQLRMLVKTSSWKLELNTAVDVHLWKEYFQFTNEELDDEMKLAESYLGASGQRLLMDAFCEHYLIKYNNSLKLCLKQCIEVEDYEVISKMHALLSRFPNGLTQMEDLLVSHVKEGFMLVREGPHDDVFKGEQLLLQRHQYDQLIIQCFSEKILEEAVNSTFRKIANCDKECTKYMTAYMDSRLRLTMTMKIEQEIEDAFKFIVKYVDGSAFKLFYRHYMADRMIKMACSYRAEEHLIEMLKNQYGSDFTENLELMLNEMESQHPILEGFNSMCSNDSPSTSFMILDSRYWPMKQREKFNLPPEMLQMVESFEAQYLHSGANTRKQIRWQTHLGSATLIVTSSSGQRYELVVSTPQMSVLMLFETADSLTYRAIREATGMTDADLRPCMRSLLSNDDISILTMKRHGDNEFSDDDLFSFNEKFSGQLDLYQKYELEPETQVEIVDEAQKHHIDAAIARIMKAKKLLDHSSLVTAVTNALKPLFITTPAAVKKRIEHLLEEEFLQRDKSDSNCYIYA